MRSITEEKFDLLVNLLQEKEIDLLMISDSEDTPNVNLQYLSGLPSDGIVLISSTGESYLVPWDLSLAQKYAEVDEILDFRNYNYDFQETIKKFIEEKFGSKSITLGVHNLIPYGIIIKYQTLLPNIKFFSEPMIISNFLEKLRATKTEYEIGQLKKAAQIGTKTIEDIKNFVQNAQDETEKDLSFLVRKKIEEHGADDIAFETLVANSSRSHEIHCYPAASTMKFALPGLALIDFGAKYQGYHSDITVPISFGKLSQKQEKIRDLTFKAYEEVINMIDIGVPLWKLHDRVEQLLKSEGFAMPYSLGHGLGLTIHDSPFIHRKPTNEFSLKYWKEEVVEEGMVFTIEPGVIKEGVGGHRLENDVVIHKGKVEIITKSRYIQIK